MTSDRLLQILRDKLGDRLDRFLVPPPVFESMQAEFVDFDAQAGWLEVQVPVLSKFLNPYGAMQGGMIAAAVDNTLGPLSMLVAPPNVTRRLELKYSRPITPEMGVFIVHAALVAREGSQLTFRADVRSLDGQLLARARATHWILPQEETQ